MSIHAAAASSVVQTIQKTAPPVAVSGLTILGLSMPDWVYLLTATWTVLQIAGWAYDRWKGKK